MSLALWLRGGRAERGLSIEDVARVTKIQPRILERLEGGKLDGLPADVFVRGFIRSVAKCCGLDETEALARYAAAAAAHAQSPSTAPTMPTARAMVEAMSELAPEIARHVTSAAPATPSSTAPSGLVRVPSSTLTPPVSEPMSVEPGPSSSMAMPEAMPAASPSKKKKRRGAKRANKKQRLATGTPAIPSAVVVASSPSATAPASEMNRDGADDIARDTALDAAANAANAATDVAAHAAPDVAATDVAHGAPDGAASDVTASDVTATDVAHAATDIAASTSDASASDSSAIAATKAAVDTPVPFDHLDPLVVPPDDDVASSDAQTWQPQIPKGAISTPVSTAPWRRPYLATTSPVRSVPSLVIDDADPESAAQVIEDREAEQVVHRRSFLPPILLDREDRSARQGGLTLAVIILLIAATLTLSYLMRRPSSSGDGVTFGDTETQLLG